MEKPGNDESRPMPSRVRIYSLFRHASSRKKDKLTRNQVGISPVLMPAVQERQTRAARRRLSLGAAFHSRLAQVGWANWL